MDEHLDLWMEDRINGGHGNILDQLNAEDQYADEYPYYPRTHPGLKYGSRSGFAA